MSISLEVNGQGFRVESVKVFEEAGDREEGDKEVGDKEVGDKEVGDREVGETGALLVPNCLKRFTTSGFKSSGLGNLTELCKWEESLQLTSQLGEGTLLLGPGISSFKDLCNFDPRDFLLNLFFKLLQGKQEDSKLSLKGWSPPSFAEAATILFLFFKKRIILPTPKRPKFQPGRADTCTTYRSSLKGFKVSPKNLESQEKWKSSLEHTKTKLLNKKKKLKSNRMKIIKKIKVKIKLAVKGLEWKKETKNLVREKLINTFSFKDEKRPSNKWAKQHKNNKMATRPNKKIIR